MKPQRIQQVGFVILMLGMITIILGCGVERIGLPVSNQKKVSSSPTSALMSTTPTPKQVNSASLTNRPNAQTEMESVKANKPNSQPDTKNESSQSPLQPKKTSTIKKTVTVEAEVGNVRKAPGDSQKIIRMFKQGTSLLAIGEATVGGDTWYEVQDGESTDGWISSEIVKLIDEPTVLLNAPLVLQLPELQRGCEVTTLTMLIEQAGKSANKMTLAKQIKILPFDKNGYRSNPNDGFVGNIYTFKQPGLGVYHGPIATLAKKYLGNQVADLTGQNWQAIEKKIDEGHAVWVIINSTFKPLPSNDPNWYTWKTKEGSIRVTYKEHSVLVTGFGPNSVYVNDPLSGIKNQQLNKSNFIAAWKQMGSQAISY